jgi:hypothetical protein
MTVKIVKININIIPMKKKANNVIVQDANGNISIVAGIIENQKNATKRNQNVVIVKGVKNPNVKSVKNLNVRNVKNLNVRNVKNLNVRNAKTKT